MAAHEAGLAAAGKGFYTIWSIRDPHANGLLTELVFASEADDKSWQQLAAILAEPLVAATHRSAFLAYSIQQITDDGVSLTGDNQYTERLGAFLATACSANPHEASHLLETLPEEVTSWATAGLAQCFASLPTVTKSLGGWGRRLLSLLPRPTTANSPRWPRAGNPRWGPARRHRGCHDDTRRGRRRSRRGWVSRCLP